MEEASELLLQAKPEQKYTGIVHGDYRLGNMLSTSDGRVAAVLDWELCTLGDVLADVGYILNSWAEPGEGGLAELPTAAPGFVTRAELARRYAELTGFELQNIAYYQSFQNWRLAAIVEGVLARYLKGVMADAADTDAFRTQVDRLAAEALRLLRTLE
jgi:aminoglycoside phosphotransferase (APT) family kinase protein